MILVISGPGGVGKGTVVRELLQRVPGLWLSRSWTTRQRREGEAEDAYVFATVEEFDRRVAEGGFLEWVEFLDYRQGSPVPEPPPDHDIVFEIDVHGARAIKERFPEAELVYLDVPSPEEQAARLRGRGEDPERIVQRLAMAGEEKALAQEAGCRFLVNDDLESAVAAIESLIARLRAAGAQTVE